MVIANMPANMPMPAIVKFELRIDEANQNSTTGHITVQAHIVETLDDGSEIHGSPETVGVDPLSLKSRWDGDIGRWREFVKSTMLARHQTRRAATADVLAWVGGRF